MSLYYKCRVCGIQEDKDRVPEFLQIVHSVAYLKPNQERHESFPVVCESCWRETLRDWDSKREMYEHWATDARSYIDPEPVEGRHGWYLQ